MEKNMKRILILIFLMLVVSISSLRADFEGLQPGISTKKEADRVLGRPIRVIREGIRYDYDPTKYDARRISIKFKKNTQIIETIDLYMKEKYRKSQYKEWFDLKKRVNTEIDNQGNLVEYYHPAVIALHYEGADNSLPVAYFSHFDPGLIPKTPTRYDRPPVKKNQVYYEKEADIAHKKKNCIQLKQILDEGLRFYPKSAVLWRKRMMYYFPLECESDPIQKREAKRSAIKAYELNPTASHAVNLGWLYQREGDCLAALHYYQSGIKYAAKHPDLYFFIAKCYEVTGDQDRAKSYYHTFLMAAPKHKHAPEAVENLRILERR